MIIGYFFLFLAVVIIPVLLWECMVYVWCGVCVCGDAKEEGVYTRDAVQLAKHLAWEKWMFVLWQIWVFTQPLPHQQCEAYRNCVA